MTFNTNNIQAITVSADTLYGDGSNLTGLDAQTTITIVDTVHLPRLTVYVTEQPVTLHHIPPKVIRETVYVRPPAQVIKVPFTFYHNRVCGPYNPQNGDYNRCTGCIDSWLANNPDSPLQAITSSNTGCNSNKIKLNKGRR